MSRFKPTSKIYIKGTAHPHSKGERYVNPAGYVVIYVDNERALEHRHIMETYLGRPLEKGEVVHHIDYNRANNDIGNLRVMTNSDHVRLHKLAQAAPSNETRRKMSEAKKLLTGDRAPQWRKDVCTDLIVTLVAEGWFLKDIAKRLCVGKGTVVNRLKGVGLSVRKIRGDNYYKNRRIK